MDVVLEVSDGNSCVVKQISLREEEAIAKALGIKEYKSYYEANIYALDMPRGDMWRWDECDEVICQISKNYPEYSFILSVYDKDPCRVIYCNGNIQEYSGEINFPFLNI